MRKDLRGVDLTGANLTNADLYNTDLTNADLTDADLTDADLHDTFGDGKVIKTIDLPRYTVNIVKSLGVIQIGCQRHTAEKWFSFGDDEIEDMDDDHGALEWWREHKQLIKEEYDNA